MGFDTLAAEAVIRFRENHTDVRPILALPCKNQTRRWKEESVERYEAVLNAANDVIFVSEAYDYGCMRSRNKYMVGHSSVCVCYLTQKKGGTAYTVSYAAKKGRHSLYRKLCRKKRTTNNKPCRNRTEERLTSKKEKPVFTKICPA